VTACGPPLAYQQVFFWLTREDVNHLLSIVNVVFPPIFGHPLRCNMLESAAQLRAGLRSSSPHLPRSLPRAARSPTQLAFGAARRYRFIEVQPIRLIDRPIGRRPGCPGAGSSGGRRRALIGRVGFAPDSPLEGAGLNLYGAFRVK
jgi:hypothetical protein